MSKIVFVPLTDDMMFERPDMIKGPITAYQTGVFRKDVQSASAKESLRSPAAYLQGDLVNGLNVVYVGDEPTTKNTAV